MQNKLSYIFCIFVHFCLTSQDVNSVANTIMLKNSIQKVLLPRINNILINLKSKIMKWSKEPMLSHTHGQAASPTFVGKELLVFIFNGCPFARL